MIRNITELLENIYSTSNDINTIKSQNPSEDDIFYDINKSKTYIFKNGNWMDLSISYKDACLNKKRIRKIKNIF